MSPPSFPFHLEITCELKVMFVKTPHGKGSTYSVLKKCAYERVVSPNLPGNSVMGEVQRNGLPWTMKGHTSA